VFWSGGDGVPGAVAQHAARLSAAPDRVPLLGALPQLPVAVGRLPRLGRQPGHRCLQPPAHAPRRTHLTD
jgi:hypothetical protein